MARTPQPSTEEWLAQQVNRVVATILGFKEAEVDEFLPKEVSDGLRAVVRRELHDLRDVVQARVRVLESSGDGVTVINQAYLDRIDEIHEAVVAKGG